MGNNYALSVGIKTGGKLPLLDGAIADAHAFAKWHRAPSQSHEVRLITDGDKTMAIDRLRLEINSFLTQGISRLLICYSGHGLCIHARDYWLLSNFDRDVSPEGHPRSSALP
jgi:hypothetical protein